MTEEQMQYFLSAVKHGNFSAAAADCYVSQPTISRQIIALEQEIGTPLFLRRGRKLELTPAGRYMVEMARTYTAQCARLRSSCRQIGAGSVALSIRTSPWVSHLITEPMIRFAKGTGYQPDFTCTTLSERFLVEDLEKAEQDAIFCSELCARWANPDLTVTPIYRKNWLVAASVTHGFWSLPGRERAWLEGQTVIRGNPWMDGLALPTLDRNNQFEPACYESLHQKKMIYGGMGETQLAMARAGMGVLLVPPWLPDYLLRGLRTEDCLAVPYEPTIVMVTKNRKGHPNLPLLKQIVRDYFEVPEIWN